MSNIARRIDASTHGKRNWLRGFIDGALNSHCLTLAQGSVSRAPAGDKFFSRAAKSAAREFPPTHRLRIVSTRPLSVTWIANAGQRGSATVGFADDTLPNLSRLPPGKGGGRPFRANLKPNGSGYPTRRRILGSELNPVLTPCSGTIKNSFQENTEQAGRFIVVREVLPGL